jgi:serine/threonine-protein kinase
MAISQQQNRWKCGSFIPVLTSVTHRDIKPANIMITSVSRIKLMDFGIARSRAAPGLTSTGVAMGSVHYMSPEVIQASSPDERSDIYSLGVTCYELLTGQRPFPGKSHFEIMKAHLEVPPVSPDQVNSNVSRQLAAAVLCAMAKSPDNRFQSAGDFRSALENCRRKEVGGMTAVPGTLTPPNGNTVPNQSGGLPLSQIPFYMPAAAPSGWNGSANWNPDPVMLNRAAKELAKYVGPIANILVSRATKRATEIEQFYRILADEIPSLTDRLKFMGFVAEECN